MLNVEKSPDFSRILLAFYEASGGWEGPIFVHPKFTPSA
jgi:hypothetical protein